MLFITSGPSGSGKTTLCRLVEDRLKIPHHVSYTTRPQRSGETHGVHYFFVEPSEFDRMVQAEEFVEWAWVHGNRYGTAYATLKQALSDDIDLILDLDTQGAIHLKQKIPQAILIFVDVPDAVLLERLQGRGSESQDSVEMRLKNAIQEREMKDQYDVVLINHELEETFLKLVEIIRMKKAL